jgi:hypothetical protein
LAELILTAYDTKNYVREALPALKAAIYRADLSQARDVLAMHDDTLYDEYELSRVLVDDDFSWAFSAADPESMDPAGVLVGLTYPLILAYHLPDVMRMTLGGPELDKILPFAGYMAAGGAHAMDTYIDADTGLTIQPGYREGLRGMWEIMGYMTPDDVSALRAFCRGEGRERAGRRSEGAVRLLDRLGEGLKGVTEKNLGLVLERE